MFLFWITENNIHLSLFDGVLGTALVRIRMPGGVGGASERQFIYLSDHLPDLCALSLNQCDYDFVLQNHLAEVLSVRQEGILIGN